MDLSAVIFVALALAWAVYLIPKALKHHDEMASDRLIEGHSDKVRILSRHGKSARAQVAAEPVEELDESTPKPKAAPVPRPPVRRPAGRSAAQRRRRVLSVLLLALAVVVGLAWFVVVPWWSAALPGGMVVLFLVVARLSVRKAKAGRRIAASRRSVASEEVAEPVAVVQPVETATSHAPENLVERLTEQDMTGARRQEIEAVLADDGSLWDPLPMTLPTYVNKARARRTVRTIELTGINSSGHDPADTALAREAQESAADSEAAQRKAAGA